MVKTRKKGLRIQLKAIKELESEGCLVGRVERVGRHIKIKDLFGLFDLLSLDFDKIRLIQITCNRPHTHKPYKEFAVQYCREGLQLEQWVWLDRLGWIKYTYLSDGLYTKTKSFKKSN